MKYTFLLIITLIMQFTFWQKSHKILPDMTIVPDVLDVQTLKAISFGDEQFTFRIMVFLLGNAGDTFGRTTALRDYDMSKIYYWFKNLDKLDYKSNSLPNMAAYYFSQTQNISDTQYLSDYLYEYSKDRVKEKWWWLMQAVYIAMHKLKDMELAIKYATPVLNEKELPLWVRQMPAFIYEKQDEFGAALKIIESILDNIDDIPTGEINFMRHFVDERLHKLNELSDKNAKKLQ